jgi:tetratricopeptide (TPR) repeat protein
MKTLIDIKKFHAFMLLCFGLCVGYNEISSETDRVEALLETARAHYQAGRYEEAKEVLEKAGKIIDRKHGARMYREAGIISKGPVVITRSKIMRMSEYYFASTRKRRLGHDRRAMRLYAHFEYYYRNMFIKKEFTAGKGCKFVKTGDMLIELDCGIRNVELVFRLNNLKIDAKEKKLREIFKKTSRGVMRNIVLKFNSKKYSRPISYQHYLSPGGNRYKIVE